MNSSTNLVLGDLGDCCRFAVCIGCYVLQVASASMEELFELKLGFHTPFNMSNYRLNLSQSLCKNPALLCRSDPPPSNNQGPIDHSMLQMVRSVTSIDQKGLTSFLLDLLQTTTLAELNAVLHASVPMLGKVQALNTMQQVSARVRSQNGDRQGEIEAGGGSGAGFQIYCGGQELVTVGGGGGGGVDIGEWDTYGGGGGGGVQMRGIMNHWDTNNGSNASSSIGSGMAGVSWTSIGGGCGGGSTSGGGKGCDVTSFVPSAQYAAARARVLQQLAQCMSINQLVVVGGGGGGGYSIAGGEAGVYGFGFSISSADVNSTDGNSTDGSGAAAISAAPSDDVSRLSMQSPAAMSTHLLDLALHSRSAIDISFDTPDLAAANMVHCFAQGSPDYTRCLDPRMYGVEATASATASATAAATAAAAGGTGSIHEQEDKQYLPPSEAFAKGGFGRESGDDEAASMLLLAACSIVLLVVAVLVVGAVVRGHARRTAGIGESMLLLLHPLHTTEQAAPAAPSPT
jgi:hypothetical protein